MKICVHLMKQSIFSVLRFSCISYVVILYYYKWSFFLVLQVEELPFGAALFTSATASANVGVIDEKSKAKKELNDKEVWQQVEQNFQELTQFNLKHTPSLTISQNVKRLVLRNVLWIYYLEVVQDFKR